MERIIFIIFVIISTITLSYCVIGKIFLKFLREKVKDFIINSKKIKEIFKKDDKVLETSYDPIEEAKRQTDIIEERERGLWWLTLIVSLIELAIFGILSFLIFKDESTISFFGKIKIFGAFLGGWLGIKVLSNHKAWSNEIVGKAYYHISLIGTLFNILIGSFAGWIIYNIINK